MQRLEVETVRGFIYKITNKINGKNYIGQTIQNVKERFYQHCAFKCDESVKRMPIHRAIKKYGKDNFTLEVIEEVDSKLLDEKERFWIDYYDTFNNGYNATIGGQDGHKPFKDLDIISIIKLYKEEKSLRAIAKEFNIDKQTIKNLLVRQRIKLRTTRTQKLSQEDRKAIIEEINDGTARKEIIDKYKISKSYLSQLINGYRRI